MNAEKRTVDETACAFLQLLLPAQGHYAALIVEPRRKYNIFAATIQKLWAAIKAKDHAGHTIYHACASFKEAHHDLKGTPSAQRRLGRTKYNVKKAKAFWLDVDAGPEKPYADWKEALCAVVTFSEATGLPMPLWLRSGQGLHVYWPLIEELDRETWEPYAKGLKALCVQHGLHVDHNRTVDISSVLRTPGTHHRKNKDDIREVICGPLAGPFSITSFTALLDVPCARRKRDASWKLPDRSKTPAYLAQIPVRDLAQTIENNLSHHWPSSGAIIAEHCEQIRELRDKQGRLAEPLWYAALCVLAFAQDGDQLAHEWSSGDARYTPEETQERLERARQFGPTTCAKFYDLNPSICERCQHRQKIQSPIVLGRRQSKDFQNAQNGPPILDGSKAEPNPFLQSGPDREAAAVILRWYGEDDPRVKRKGGALFIAAEGASEIPIRIHAIVEKKFPDHQGKLPFAWVERCPPLRQPNALNELECIAKEAINRMRSEFGVELALIIIDTVSAAAGFTDENSSSEGQQVMNVLNELSARTGALVMACDHFGKAIETGTRGTSAKEAAADIVIACLGERTQGGAVSNLRIAVRKLRGGATGSETAFSLRTVDMGVDEDGEAITSCVIDWSPVTISASKPAKDGWTKSMTLFRSALLTTVKLYGSEQKPFPNRPKVRAVALDKVREEFDKCFPIDQANRPKDMNRRRQAFKRSSDEAQRRGLIEIREIDGTYTVWLAKPEGQDTEPGSFQNRPAA